MRIAVAATPEVALPTLERLASMGHEIVFLITQPDRPSGRGREVNESAVSRWGREHEIEVLKPDSMEEIHNRISGVDCVVVIAFGTIFKKDTLDIPKHGFINLHFSHLPKWRGAAPVQRAIENGDQEIGITVFLLDSGMDTGPIFTQAVFPLNQSLSAGLVLEFLSTEGASEVVRALELIEDGQLPHPQSASGESVAPKISKDQAFINWNESAEIIERKIRAFNPSPMAWTLFRDQPIKISSAKISRSKLSLSPGELRVDGKELLSGTSSSSLEISSLIPSGKDEMSARAWANGARLITGDHFG